MAEYVGSMRIRNHYANFVPLYLYEKGSLVELSEYDKQELLPKSDMRDINFTLNSWGKRPDVHFMEGEAYVFDLDVDKLEETGLRTGYRCDASRLIDTHKLQPVQDIGLYYVLHADQVDGDFRTSQFLDVMDPNVFSDLEVMLEYEDRQILLGPFTVQLAEGQYYIDTEYTQNKYLLHAVRFPTYYSEYIYDLGTEWDEPREYVMIPPQAKKFYVDTITDTQLLEEFKTALDGSVHLDGKLNLSDLEKLTSSYEASYFMGKELPEDTKKSRLNRLVRILTDESKMNETLSYIADVFGDILMKYQGKDSYNEFIQQLINTDEIAPKLQGLDIVTGRVKEEEAKLKDLQKQVIDQQQRLDAAKKYEEELKQEYKESLKDTLEDDLVPLREEYDDLKQKIAKGKEELGIIGDISILKSESERLQKEIEKKDYRNDQLTYNLKELDKKLDHLFEEKTETAMRFSFDGMLANRMLRQAAEWENNERRVDYSKKVDNIKHIRHSVLSGEDLVEYLLAKVKEIRPDYGRNVVLNLFICYTQNFLTVLSGAPGTGKTSICRIMASVLGLVDLDREIADASDGYNPDRFVPIAVERGWTTKRDFIGYYNPLTKTFDRSNRQIFDGLNILDTEVKDGDTDLPYMILLDEANLSSMEYYWADFMSFCDNLDGVNRLNLGDDYIFAVPNLLRFVATINNDHTTEALSPRLVDRAFIVRLPKVAASETSYLSFKEQTFEHISWNSMLSTFSVSDAAIKPMSGAAKEVYDGMLSELRKCNLSVSPRVERAMKRYWSVAQGLFEADTGNIDASIVALDYAFSQKILPQINGTGDAYGEKLKNALKYAKEHYLRNTTDCLSEIIQRGDNNMSYYQFFA